MKILFIPEAIALAHLSRLLPIANTMRQNGFQCSFACGAVYKNFIIAEGFECYDLFTLRWEDFLPNLIHFKPMYNKQTVERYVEAELKCLEQIKPDAVIGDFRNTLRISTGIKKIPYSAVINAYLTSFYAAKMRLPENFFLAKIFGDDFMNAVPPFLRNFVKKTIAFQHGSAFRDYTKRHGLAPIQDFFHAANSPFLNLIADAQEFAPCSNLPLNYRYVGPLLWQPAMAIPEVFARINESRPSIYLTLGTTGEKGLLALAKEAFGNEPYNILTTTGDAEFKEKLPDNFFASPYAPALELIERASLVICHGGINTIYQALSRGKPVIGLPVFSDQEFHLQRVVELKLGISLRRGRVNSRNLSQAADEVIRDLSYSQNARDFSEVLKSYQQAPQTACSIIQAFLSDKKGENKRR